MIQILDGKIIKDQKNTTPMKEVNEEVTEEISKENNENQKVAKVKQNLRFFSAIKLEAHNIKQKLKRNILVALGVSIGIMSVVMMLALGNGIKAYFSNMIESFMNPLVVEVSMPQGEVDPNDPMASMQAVIGSKPTFKKCYWRKK